MADTKPDVQLDKTQYVDVYAATGLAVGTPILIQNKSSQNVYIQIQTTQPSALSRDGGIIQPFEQGLIDTGENGCWVLGDTNGKISVQEA